MHTNLIAVNSKHRPYKRHLPVDSDLLDIANDVETGLPPKHRNESVLLEWKRNGVRHVVKSSTNCLPPPPPHMPITLFRTLDDIQV